MNKIIIYKSSFDNKKEEWTSYSDIGKTFDHNLFSLESYQLIENQYLNFIKDILKEFQISKMQIKKLENYENLKWRNKKICADEVIAFSKDCLREKCWGVLHSKKMKIIFGYDYYLIIETDYDLAKFNIIVKNNKLFSKDYYKQLNFQNKTKIMELDKNIYLGFEIFSDNFKLSQGNKTYNVSYSLEGDYKCDENNNSYYVLQSVKYGIFKKKKDDIIYEVVKSDNSIVDFINQFNINFNTNLQINDIKKINKKPLIRIYYQLFTGELTCIDFEYQFYKGKYQIKIHKKNIASFECLQFFIDTISSFINECMFSEKNFSINLLDYIKNNRL